jgi:hypothetical protein
MGSVRHNTFQQSRTALLYICSLTYVALVAQSPNRSCRNTGIIAGLKARSRGHAGRGRWRATVIMVVSAGRHSPHVTAGGTYSQTMTDQGRRLATHLTRGRIAIPVGWPQANGSWQKGHGRLRCMVSWPSQSPRAGRSKQKTLMISTAFAELPTLPRPFSCTPYCYKGCLPHKTTACVLAHDLLAFELPAAFGTDEASSPP